MDPALKLQQEMDLEKYEALNIADKRRVRFHMDDLAKEKGYFNEKELKEKKRYIWDQMCADTVSKLFP